MRTKDVRVGETYRCEVPLALPWRRVPAGDDGRLPAAAELTARHVLPAVRGRRGRRGPDRAGCGDGGEHPGHGGAHRGPGAGGRPPARRRLPGPGMLLDAEGEPVELPQRRHAHRAAAVAVPGGYPRLPQLHDASVRGIR
ncbi:hypothetical protein LT493_29645 [Streptomyces tricolor]|nr:hypothetical protein [Streptomyces tricolor]